MPKTEEEYNALPMGTVYIHPDLGRMIKQDVTGRPGSVEEFEQTVGRLKAQDMDAARAYYDKWVSEWQ
ncbi:MAG: hypothetical protein ACYTEQ_11425 [Planctomycetota bacterium]